MMLFVVVCFIAQAQAYSRIEGEIDEYDLMDELSFVVFGYEIKRVQTIYSEGISKAEKYLESNGLLKEFYKKSRHWPLDSKQRETYLKLFDTMRSLAMRTMSRSDARAVLIQDYLALPEDIQRILKKQFTGFLMIEFMSHSLRK